MRYLTLLLLASLGLALPINEGPSTQPSLTQDAKTLTAHQWIMLGKPGFKDSPTFQEYVERHREELAFIRSNEKEYNLPGSDPKHTQPEHSHPKKPYGVFLGKWIPFQNGTPHCGNATQTATYTKPLDILDIMENYGPECVGLAIFVLVPIAYFVLELLELTFKYFVRERFPERGRSPVRLSGPERQLRALNDLHREQMVQSEKQWWHARGRG